MVRPPATSEAGAHAAGDTKSEHFEPAGVRKLSAKLFSKKINLATAEFISIMIIYYYGSYTTKYKLHYRPQF
jgi:hypothetical protein